MIKVEDISIAKSYVSLGSLIEICGAVYILAWVGEDKYAAISLESGNRYQDAKKIKDSWDTCHHIALDELSKELGADCAIVEKLTLNYRLTK